MAEKARWGFDVSRGAPLVIACARSCLCAEKTMVSVMSVGRPESRGDAHHGASESVTSIAASSIKFHALKEETWYAHTCRDGAVL